MDYKEQKQLEQKMYMRWTTIVVFSLITVIGLCMYGCPKYNVWQQGLSGEAELARATQNRQIKIQEAEAVKESAQRLADAEVIRATGAANAANIIKQSLDPNYLKYLWIQSINTDGNKEVIYIPTEAGLPITEAGKRR